MLNYFYVTIWHVVLGFMASIFRQLYLTSASLVLLLLFTFASSAQSTPPAGVYSFQGLSGQVTANGTDTLLSNDGFFELRALDGSGKLSRLIADEYGTFISESGSDSGTSWIEVRVADGGSFVISDAVIGDYASDRSDFYDVHAVGLVSGDVVAQTQSHSSIGVFETDYNLDFTSFSGVSVDAFRIYYSWNGAGHGQTSFNFQDITLASTSTEAPADSTAPTVVISGAP
ncbi:MAG: hypothetical protein Q7J06_01570, partial [Bacteroidales bacterium]|nr:hypothetical protein [Bacteroidales bacterium]